MRPLELRLRHFRSYAGETTFDFRGRRLVGVVGPIGSGKSSMLDAVAFALYGKTPAGGAATKALIHQRSGDAAVSLRFSVDGEVWEAVRSIRRRGASQHALYRYEDDADGAEPVERLTMEAEVTAKVIELLGLDFDAFGRSVLLAQGRFAEFLQARPADRDKVLKGVFGHDRLTAMHQVARQRLQAGTIDLEKLTVALQHVDGIAKRLIEAKAELATAEAWLERLQKAEPQLTDLDNRNRAAVEQAEAARSRLEMLERESGRLPGDDIVRSEVEEALAATTRRAELAEALERSHRQAALADAKVAAADDEGVSGKIEEVDRLLSRREVLKRNAERAARQHREALDALEVVGAAVTAGATATEAATAAEARTAAEAASAADAVAAAEAALDQARHADMAGTLRDRLTEGSRCPVCEQDVHVLPGPGAGGAVDAAEQALATSRAARERADATHVAAVAAAGEARADDRSRRERAERLAAEVESAQAAKTDAVAEVDAADAQLQALLGTGDPHELLAQLRSAHQGLVDAATAARAESDRIRREHDAAITVEQERERRLADTRTQVATLAGRLDPDVTVADVEAEALGGLVVELRRRWSTEAKRLRSVMTEAEGVIAEVARARGGIVDDLDLDGDIKAALGRAEERCEQLAAGIARDDADVAAARELATDRERLEAEVGRWKRLATDLTDSRFVRYLLDDERTRLATLGSDHFQRLTAGRYRFTDDGVFDVVDLTAADAVRKAGTLSGGETFLASLGLALALAEMVARTGGRLDAFFLDEGFGTLDPEHLDLAMEGIESLVAAGSDRLVVVVSHVPELKERLEDLIVLDRNPVTGDTVVVGGQGTGAR